MDLPNGSIPFPKNEYTVPEIVKIVANYYGIYLQDLKSRDKVFQAMDQRIRDELHKIEGERWAAGEENGTELKRRRFYPREWIDVVINERLSAYFPKVEAGQENSLRKKWEELAAEYAEKCENGTYDREIAEYYTDEASKSPFEKSLLYSLECAKKEILMDIVFNCLVELDEERLREDLAASLRFTEDFKPKPEDMRARENLKNLSNYYKWRNKKLEDLLKN